MAEVQVLVGRIFFDLGAFCKHIGVSSKVNRSQGSFGVATPSTRQADLTSLAVFAIATVDGVKRHAAAIPSALGIGAAHASTLTALGADFAALVPDQTEAALRASVAACAIIRFADLGAWLGTATLGQANLIL